MNRKLISLIFSIALSLSVFSCSKYDDTKVWNELNSLDSRVEKLETLCSQMNTNISSLQTIVTALQNNDGITNVYQLPNGEGYTISFTSGKTITIYNGVDGKDGVNGTNGKDGKDGANGSDGKDGKNGVDGTNGKDGVAPVVGVKMDTDGIYYWTLNGEWLTDDAGNKIKAVGTDGKNGADGQPGADGKDGQNGADGKDGKDGVDGTDGKDGITPQLRIEDGYWYVSTDNGSTWTMLGKATGENGNDGTNGKDGKDGDTMFSSVVENEDNVVFTLADGTRITIDKSKSLSISFEASEIGVEPGKSKEMAYTLTGASANVKVKVVAQDGWSAKVTSCSQTGGVIRVTAPNASAESEVTVLVSDGSNAIMSSFVCIRKDKDADLTIVVVSDKVSIPMVWVEEDVHGFWMGSEGFVSNETPAHLVQLSGFYICKYEVTQELWEIVMGSNPSYFRGVNLPVEQVSWDDCQDFIVKLNQMTKRQFRLPTEAEWEYAARGGRERKGYKYSGSDEVNEVAWYEYNSDSISHVVGTKAPNELGIYDMSGNVWEWCQDYYGSYSSDTQTDPTGPKTGTERTYRGGGWDYSADGQRCIHRGMSPSTRKYKSIGLRLAMSAE